MYVVEHLSVEFFERGYAKDGFVLITRRAQHKGESARFRAVS